MDAIGSGRLETLAALDDASIERDAGLSAHESKTWLIARAALPRAGFAPTLRWYRAIPEFIAGYGLMFLQGGSSR
jgi:2,3-dihydroxyphenylpropionate 1,2-dioxygenase